jgi:plasmid stability protein
MATDLTIHNLDENLMERLRAEAQRRGVGIDSIVSQALLQMLPQSANERNGAVQRDVSELAGVWGEAEAEEFFAAIKDLEQVDQES